MHKPYVICHCGSCETVMSRVVETVRKQLLDAECPVFLVAHALAWQEIGSLFTKRLIEQHPREALDILAGVRITDEELQREFRHGDYASRIQAAIDAHHQRNREERDLPKGD